MLRKSYLFTSESVSEGHPDKVCDRISDEVVDLFFREGPKAGTDPWQLRVACETLATTNQVVIAGETRGPSTITKDWVAAQLAIIETRMVTTAQVFLPYAITRNGQSVYEYIGQNTGLLLGTGEAS